MFIGASATDEDTPDPLADLKAHLDALGRDARELQTGIERDSDAARDSEERAMAAVRRGDDREAMVELARQDKLLDAIQVAEAELLRIRELQRVCRETLSGR